MILSTQEHAAAIDKAVFPMMQGGPLMHAVAAKAVALKEASTPQYQQYARAVIENAQALTAGLEAEGRAGHRRHRHPPGAARPAADGRHRCRGRAALRRRRNRAEQERSLRPAAPSIASGIRVRTPSVTTQGMGVAQMKEIAGLIARAVREPDAARRSARRWMAWSGSSPRIP